MPSAALPSAAVPSAAAPLAGSALRQVTDAGALAVASPISVPSLFGEREQERRAALSGKPIVRVERAGGGRSVSYKLTLEGGEQALYKPEQRFAAYWFSELAAYYLDRALGLGRVPPAVGRRVEWASLQWDAAVQPHLAEVQVGAGGTVRGAMMGWVRGRLVPLSPPKGWERCLAVDEPPVVSPFQRVADYRRQLAASLSQSSNPDGQGSAGPPTRSSADLAASPAANGAQPGPAGAAISNAASAQLSAAKRGPCGDGPRRLSEERAAELSDLVVFDYLTANHDRWGGQFTNVRTLGAEGPLIAIDNANGFPPRDRPTQHSEAKLRAVQRFRASTIHAIQRFDVEQFRQQLERDPLAPLLTRRQLNELEQRRQRLLQHVRAVRDRVGDAAMPW